MSTRRLFINRDDAGRRLAAAMKQLSFVRPVVYALPRGGVPVAAQVAAALNAPLDLVLVRKIGAPYQPELAVGAVVDGDTPELVINRDIAAAAGGQTGRRCQPARINAADDGPADQPQRPHRRAAAAPRWRPAVHRAQGHLRMS